MEIVNWVTIQIKAGRHYFIYYNIILSFDSVDEIIINHEINAVLVGLTFKSVENVFFLSFDIKFKIYFVLALARFQL